MKKKPDKKIYKIMCIYNGVHSPEEIEGIELTEKEFKDYENGKSRQLYKELNEMALEFSGLEVWIEE